MSASKVHPLFATVLNSIFSPSGPNPTAADPPDSGGEGTLVDPKPDREHRFLDGEGAEYLARRDEEGPQILSRGFPIGSQIAAAEILRLAAENEDLKAEIKRLEGWLKVIYGGDAPCREESLLRRWAYQGMLGHQPPGGSR